MSPNPQVNPIFSFFVFLVSFWNCKWQLLNEQDLQNMILAALVGVVVDNYKDVSKNGRANYIEPFRCIPDKKP